MTGDDIVVSVDGDRRPLGQAGGSKHKGVTGGFYDSPAFSTSSTFSFAPSSPEKVNVISRFQTVIVTLPSETKFSATKSPPGKTPMRAPLVDNLRGNFLPREGGWGKYRLLLAKS